MKGGLERGEDKRCCIMCVGNEGRRCERGERQSVAFLSHHRMASVGGGGGLLGVVGGCRMRTRVVVRGEIVVRPSTILSCRIEALVLREGLPLAAIEMQQFGGWLSRDERG